MQGHGCKCADSAFMPRDLKHLQELGHEPKKLFGAEHEIRIDVSNFGSPYVLLLFPQPTDPQNFVLNVI